LRRPGSRAPAVVPYRGIEQATGMTWDGGKGSSSPLQHGVCI